MAFRAIGPETVCPSVGPLPEECSASSPDKPWPEWLAEFNARADLNSERAFVEDLHGFIAKGKGVNVEPAQVSDEGRFNAHAGDQR